MVEFRYRAFICYSHRDSDWADWLHHALESYSIPPRLVGLTTSAGVIPARIAPVFRDRDELPSATDLSAKVSDALAQSACLILICSPHAAQSHWVDEEVKTFQRLGRADRIFCLIVDGEPGASAWAGREHDECLPPALTHHFDAAGKNTGVGVEPIAADVRANGDGRSNARLKLIAGMLGVGLDDLRHREKRRRRWRLTAAIGAAFALLCLTSALAVNAIIARHAAERRQKQAEDLVGFMLGDLDDKLRQVNRLDILESVDHKVVNYFAMLPAADMTDSTVLQRTQALIKLGAVRRDQGRVDEALDAFKEAAALSERLVRNAPENIEYASINAEGFTWIGFIDWSQGRLDDALMRFVAARDMLLRASAQRPDDAELLDRLGAARTNAGRVFEARGQLDDARREYAKVLEGYTYLAQREPEKLEWKTEIGYAHNNLAQLAMKEGKLEEAVRDYIADREIKANLHDLDPANNARREDLVASEAFLGRVLYLCGEPEAAQVHLRAAMDNIEALLLVDPNATDWLDKAGSFGWMLGQVARVRGDAKEAERRDEAAIARLSKLVFKDAANVGWQRKLALAEIEDARRMLWMRSPANAKESAIAAQRAIDRALAGTPDDVTTQLVAEQIQLTLGDVAEANTDFAAARDHWARARESVGSRAATSKDPATLDVWIGALLRLGETERATPALHMLANSGYRDPDFISLLTAHGIEWSPTNEIADRIALLASKKSASDAHGD